MNEREKIYTFGNFTFRVKEYNLKKGNEELYLRPKTYETLLQLIEHHGAIVKKDDLIENVWSGTIVTENTLTQCIKEIREKLGDNSANPRFIKTIPRVGYKFIAPVKELTISQNLPTEKSKFYNKEGFRLNRAKISIILLTFLLAIAIVFLIRNKESKFNFSERDWVLITDFDNQTGNEVFESALRTALEMKLSNSKYVNVVSQGRVLDILNLMRQNSDIRIDRNLGREICLRDGNIQIMISGSIYKIGNNYSLSLVIIDPLNNVIIKSYTQEVNSQQEVLPAISKLAISIRKELGESIENLPKDKKSFERVTTSSLKALNIYSKGVHYINLLDFDRAEYFLNQAVQYDTTFAMGYLMLGFSGFWRGNILEGKANFKKATQLVAGLPEREKYFILAANAVYNIGDYKKGIEYYELLLDFYPDDYWGNENLSRAYLWDGDIKHYMKFKKISEKLRPNYIVNYSDKGFFALYLDGDIVKAHKEFLRVKELNPDFPIELPHLSDAFFDWMQGDLDSADNKIAKFLSVRINKLLSMSHITSRWYISRFYIFTGRFDKALKLSEESLTLSNKQPKSKLLPWAKIELALVYWEMGQVDKFESIMKSAAASSAGIARVQALGWLAIHYARSGKVAAARKLLNELQKENRVIPAGIIQPPLNNELVRAKRAFGIQIEGEIAFVNGNINDAILHFQKVIGLVPSSHLPVLTALNPRIRWVALRSLAHIYEEMGNWDSAIAAYQKIIDEKILVITVPAASSIWINSLLSISKAFEKQGQYSKAKNYQEKYDQLHVRNWWKVNL